MLRMDYYFKHATLPAGSTGNEHLIQAVEPEHVAACADWRAREELFQVGGEYCTERPVGRGQWPGGTIGRERR